MELEVRPVLRPYEAVVIVHPDATEDEQKQIFRKNKEIIESFKGSVNHLDTWGRRNLANSIKKQKRALFFHSTFMAEPTAVAELERVLRINERVLRFMHTRLEDGTSLPKFVENFKQSLVDAANREREREAKFAQKKAGRARRDDFEAPDVDSDEE